MAIIRRQTPSQRTSSSEGQSTGVLSRIQPVDSTPTTGIHINIYGRNGTGKCLGEGTPVLLFDGTVKFVEEVEEGDLLMGPDSKPRTVLSVSTGVGPLYEVTPLKGDPWVCNDAHILTLAGVGRFYGRVKDISVSDYLQDKEMEVPGSNSWRLLRTGVDFQNTTPLSLPPYFVGLWIGDGSRGGATITNSRPEIVDYCKKVATDFGLLSKVTPDKNTLRIRFVTQFGSGRGVPHGNQFANFFREKCVVGELKTIPREYLMASRKDRLELLAGIIDTDGESYTYSYTTVCVTGQPYRDNLLFLCRSLGFAAYCTGSKVHTCTNGKVSTYFHISISGDISKIPTRARKFPSRRIEKRVNVVGFDLDPIGEGEYFGFTLDGDGRFLLGDFTVTHNTSFSCTFPKPLLLIGCEDGTKSVRKVEGVDFVRLEHTSELHELSEHIKKTDHYETVVLDTATSLQDLVLREILGLSEVPVQLAWGMVNRDQYTHRSEKVKELMRLFTDLPINVCILAQEKNHTNMNEEGGGGEDGILKPFIASSLGASACSWLQDQVDYICQTFTREGVKAVERKVAGKSVMMQERTGKIEFCLRTERAHPTFAAKMRADRTVEVPPFIVDPSWSKLVSVIEGSKSVL